MPKLAFGGKYNTENKAKEVVGQLDQALSSTRKDPIIAGGGSFAARIARVAPPPLSPIQIRQDLPDFVLSAGLKKDVSKKYSSRKLRIQLNESSVGDPMQSPILHGSKLNLRPTEPEVKKQSRLLRLGSFSDQDEPAGNGMDSLEQLSPMGFSHRRPLLKNQLCISKS